ncbi:MAG: hypothetical protein HA494_01950 [Thaumarchaeota archaeon]|jgi:hypothetical protein|nr:hypothetical protein [Nitrososphaerota archaeon]
MLFKSRKSDKVRIKLDESKRIEVIRLIQQEGCPICRACNEHLEKGWFWFFTEAYSEGSLVSKYIDYWGFCEKHTRMVAKIGPKWQKSVIYSWTINDKIPRLQRLFKALQTYSESNFVQRIVALRGWRKIIRDIMPKGGCVFCENIAYTARYYIRALLDALAYPDVRDLYRRSPGLCMPHFFQALELLDEKYAPQLKEILEVQIEHLEQLKKDFEEFFRKEDYRFSLEPKGKEQLAWLRAMKIFSGET